MVHTHRNRVETQNVFISQNCIPDFGIVQSTFAQVNNSLPNIRRNFCDFVDVLHEIVWLSRTCVCFRSLLNNGTFFRLLLDSVFGIYKGRGLKGGNNRAGSPSRMSAQSNPQELTLSRPRADPERSPSGPKADAEFWKADPQQTPSELKANPGSSFGVHYGVRLGLVGIVILDRGYDSGG